MANEISITSSLSVTNGNLKIPTHGGQYNVTQTTAFATSFGLAATTTEEDWVLTKLTSQAGAKCIITNVGATNNIIYGTKVSGTYHPTGQIAPGEHAVIGLITGLTYYSVSNTGTASGYVVVCDA